MAKAPLGIQLGHELLERQVLMGYARRAVSRVRPKQFVGRSETRERRRAARAC